MTKKTKFDVLIVGAGPAGLSTALTIRKLSNKTVCIIEKKPMEYIGEKVCGDGLNHNCFPFIERIGIQIPKVEQYFETENLVLTVGQKTDILPFKATMIDRLEFGQSMLRKGKKQGVTIFPECVVTNAIIGDKNVRVEVKNLQNKDDTFELTTDIIIDATGISANIQKILSPEISISLSKKNHAITFRKIIKTQEEHNYSRCHMIYDHDIPTPGYFWIFPKSKKILNVGITCPQKTKNLKELFDTIFSRYCQVSNYSIIHEKGDIYSTSLPLLNSVSNRFMAVGEAASQVCPLFGEGHGPALKAGYYAGNVITKAANYSQEELFEYNKLCMDEFNGDFVLKFVMAEYMKQIDFEEFKEVIPLLVNMAASHDGLLISIVAKIPFVKPALKKLAISRIKNENTKNKIKQLMTLEKHLKKYPGNPVKFEEWKKEFEKALL
ncbi:MAG: geranylgeranyl reductase family protein [Candidatus Hodarchaeales archaeon]